MRQRRPKPVEIAPALQFRLDFGSRGNVTAHVAASFVMGRPDIRRVILHEGSAEQGRDILQELGTDELENLSALIAEKFLPTE